MEVQGGERGELGEEARRAGGAEAVARAVGKGGREGGGGGGGGGGYGRGNLEVAVLVDEEVARLQVAVQHLHRRAAGRWVGSRLKAVLHVLGAVGWGR